MAVQCGYCGNTSGRLDARGNCKSCGAPFTNSYIEKFFEKFDDTKAHHYGHTVLIPNSVAAQHIDSYNRAMICNFKDLDNGSVVQIGYKTVGSGCEVHEVLETKNDLHSLWMIYSPEVMVLPNYRGLNVNPSNFYNRKTDIMDGMKLCSGDIISISSYSIVGNPSDYISVSEKDERLYWSDKIYDDRLMFAKTAETYIVLPESMIESVKIAATKMEVIHA